MSLIIVSYFLKVNSPKAKSFSQEDYIPTFVIIAGMCRNIRTLFNFDPPATDTEIHDASLQFVRKLSGFHNPSKANEKAFEEAVEKVSHDAKHLLHSLVTEAKPHNREEEARKAHERALARFGK